MCCEMLSPDLAEPRNLVNSVGSYLCKPLCFSFLGLLDGINFADEEACLRGGGDLRGRIKASAKAEERYHLQLIAQVEHSCT